MSDIFVPVVGMGITYQINSDCYSYTIRRVSKSGHQFWASADRGTDPIDIPEDRWRKFVRVREGRYQPVGAPYVGIRTGRYSYQDPSF